MTLSPERARNASSAILASRYLNPQCVKISSSLGDFDDECNATSSLLEMLRSPAMGAFDVSAVGNDSGTTCMHPGAVVWGRLFSAVTRCVTMKSRSEDGKVVCAMPSSYDELFDDDAYMRQLGIDLTLSNSPASLIWTTDSESFHFARGVEAFLTQLMTMNDANLSRAELCYYIADLSESRRRMMGLEQDTSEDHAVDLMDFDQRLVRGAGVQDAGCGKPLRIKKLTDDAIRNNILRYVHAHLLRAKSYFDAKMAMAGAVTGAATGAVTGAVGGGSQSSKVGKAHKRSVDSAEFANFAVGSHTVPKKQDKKQDKNPTATTGINFYRESRFKEMAGSQYKENKDNLKQQIEVGAISSIVEHDVAFGDKTTKVVINGERAFNKESLESLGEEQQRLASIFEEVCVVATRMRARSKDPLSGLQILDSVLGEGKDNRTFGFKKDSDTVVRVSKDSEVGTKTADEAANEICQFAYAAACGVGVDVAMVYVFRPETLVPGTAGKKWGVLYVNERMTYNLQDSAGVYQGGDKDKRAIDAVWRLIAEMSAAGIVNLDATDSNLMLKDYSQGIVAKLIDFDSNLSNVLPDFMESPEGWKPLYVLNGLMLLYVLSQASGIVNVLFQKLKNTRPAMPIDGAIRTHRASRFADVVVETVRALGASNASNASNASSPQTLLAIPWKGGYLAGHHSKRMENLSVSQFLVHSNIVGTLVEDVEELNVGHPMGKHLIYKLFSNGFLQPAITANRDWKDRQQMFYRGLVVQNSTATYDGGHVESQSKMMEVVSKIKRPLDIEKFHKANTRLNNLFKVHLAPAMHHTLRERDQNYRVIDLLSDYVFTTDARDARETRETRETLENNLLPYYPRGTVADSNTWDTGDITDDIRGLLAMPPYTSNDLPSDRMEE